MVGFYGILSTQIAATDRQTDRQTGHLVMVLAMHSITQ